jgi:GT2 family glycosyltransferase
LKTLQSITLAISQYQESIDILVIVNACTDDTVIKLQSYQHQQIENNLLPIKFIEVPKAGKSYALNTAIAAITNGWVCFIDDDHRVDKNYLQAIISAIKKHSDTRLFCGKIIPDWRGDEPMWIHEKGSYSITPTPIPHFDLGETMLLLSEKNFLPGGGNLIINQEVFKKIGGFSETLGPIGHNLVGSEDTDLILRALRVNEKLRYIPGIIQYHYVDLSRFKLTYLLLMNFQRNRSFNLSKYEKGTQVPSYLWLILIQYICGVLFSFNTKVIRFYLIKTASIVGQIVGIIHSRQ